MIRRRVVRWLCIPGEKRRGEEQENGEKTHGCASDF
jgi:hypothetical protein